MKKGPKTTDNTCVVDLEKSTIKESQPDAAENIVERKSEDYKDVADDSQCDKCNFKSKDPYSLKQHKRDEHREKSVSVTPPPKKRMEPEKNIEEEVEIIVNKIQDMDVSDESVKHVSDKNQIPEENQIPERLRNMLRYKGINIDCHCVIKVGGDGKCGAYCVSIHTTGSDKFATEIRTNINRHILENWEIYKDSFEYPYTARVGGGTKVFKTEDELMIFLMEEVKEASTMWMTHVCMQAAATMLNININILTTGISATSTNKCARCKSVQIFSNQNDFILHNEKVHNRIETDEEKEGRSQNARWTILKPDHSIKESGSHEKTEELTLLHEDETHYNLIVTKTRLDNYKVVEETTIFGDTIQPKEKRSWAKIQTRHFPPTKMC